MIRASSIDDPPTVGVSPHRPGPLRGSPPNDDLTAVAGDSIVISSLSDLHVAPSSREDQEDRVFELHPRMSKRRRIDVRDMNKFRAEKMLLRMNGITELLKVDSDRTLDRPALVREYKDLGNLILRYRAQLQDRIRKESTEDFETFVARKIVEYSELVEQRNAATAAPSGSSGPSYERYCARVDYFEKAAAELKRTLIAKGVSPENFAQ